MPPRDARRDGPPSMPDSFADGVMRAIASASPPSPTRTFLRAMRVRSLGNAVTALIVAWHLGTVRAWPISPRVRARSFALVFAVAFVLGTGTLAAAGAVTVVVQPRLELSRPTDRAGMDTVVAPSDPGTRSVPSSPTPDPERVPAVVHEADHAAGGKTTTTPARQTQAPAAADDDTGGSTGGDAADGSDGDDGHDPSGDDRDGSSDDDHDGSADEHESETPEPDDHGTDGHDDDGHGGDDGHEEDGSGG